MLNGLCEALAEAHAAAVAMGVRSLVTVTSSGGIAELSEDDHAGGAAVDAERTAGADIVVDGEDDVIVGIFTGLFGTDGAVDGIGGDHVDALPRADVDAAFAGDAFALIDVDELLRLDRLGKPGRICLLYTSPSPRDATLSRMPSSA